MKRNFLSRKTIFRLLIILLTMNIQYCVLPGGITQSYGLFGEMTSYLSAENQETVLQSSPLNNIRNKQCKSISRHELLKARSLWILTLLLLFIYYLQYWHTIAFNKTPVRLKVRMNH